MKYCIAILALLIGSLAASAQEISGAERKMFERMAGPPGPKWAQYCTGDSGELHVFVSDKTALQVSLPYFHTEKYQCENNECHRSEMQYSPEYRARPDTYARYDLIFGNAGEDGTFSTVKEYRIIDGKPIVAKDYPISCVGVFSETRDE